MAVIVNKTKLGETSVILEIGGIAMGKAGQFYMLRAGKNYPLLSRPISVFDVDEAAKTVSFFIEIVGCGTEIFSKMKKDTEIEVFGPYGNGFTACDSDSVLIGGSCGTAPLFYLAKTLKKLYPNKNLTTYIGYSHDCEGLDFFKKIFKPFGHIVTDVGGYITNKVDFNGGIIYACGPMPMMKAVKEKTEKNSVKAYLSLESRMACGVGACLGCTIETTLGNKRVCKDGPVFDSREVLL
ncbi:MAG TPA: dihydroorotate dehydrogenase electron transfer subunit [Clostridia bacterium]|nr:dihydroorotate dehydrogenase electron transfer subunit [Clostridia bacterium]